MGRSKEQGEIAGTIEEDVQESQIQGKSALHGNGRKGPIWGSTLRQRNPPSPCRRPSLGKTQGEQMNKYFNALALAVSTDQNVLVELVAFNSKLTKTNLDVTSVAQLTKANKALTTKLGQAGMSRPGEKQLKLCCNCKKKVLHVPNDYFELESNKDRRPRGWVTGL